MKESDLVKSKAATLGIADLKAELARIGRALDGKPAPGPRKRYESRGKIYLARLRDLEKEGVPA